MPSKPQTEITHPVTPYHKEVLEKSRFHLHCASVLSLCEVGTAMFHLMHRVAIKMKCLPFL